MPGVEPGVATTAIAVLPCNKGRHTRPRQAGLAPGTGADWSRLPQAPCCLRQCRYHCQSRASCTGHGLNFLQIVVLKEEKISAGNAALTDYVPCHVNF